MWDWIYQKVIYGDVSNYGSRKVKIKLLSYLPDSAFTGVKELRSLLDCTGLGRSDQQKWDAPNEIYYGIRDKIIYFSDENSNHVADAFEITILDYDWIMITSYKNDEIYSLYRK